MVQWKNLSRCKPGLAGMIPGFTSLSDENLSCGPCHHMTLAVGGMLNINTQTDSF